MITKEQMKALEDAAGISTIVLMERAGEGVANVIKENHDIKNKRILILSYHGNNGGDGFVAARYLCEEAEVDVLFVGDESKLTRDAKTNYKRIENNDMIQMPTIEAIDFSDYGIIVDAVFGTGVRGEIKDPLATIIKKVNQSKAHKVSIDVPSGIDPDTGKATNVCFEPDTIVAIHALKKGLAPFKDKTVVVDIGIKG